MRLVRCGANPDRFKALAEGLVEGSIFRWPLSLRGADYYEATLADPGEDVSFLIEGADKAVIALFCNVREGILERYGQSAELLYDKDMPSQVLKRALGEAMGEIRRLTLAKGVRQADILTQFTGISPDYLAGTLISAQFVPEPYFGAIVDLAAGREAMLSGLRKGHQQQVRWGQANLEIRLVNKARPDAADFELYRALHAVVAGRATRGDESWNAMFATLVAGEGRLVLSSFGGDLMGGTLVMDAGDTAFYASGAYRREHFDKPLAHYPLFAAMEQSAAEGQRWFTFGDVSTPPTLPEKERSIAYFKRGFAAQMRTALRWRWEAAGA